MVKGGCSPPYLIPNIWHNNASREFLLISDPKISRDVVICTDISISLMMSLVQENILHNVTSHDVTGSKLHQNLADNFYF